MSYFTGVLLLLKNPFLVIDREVTYDAGMVYFWCDDGRGGTHSFCNDTDLSHINI